MALQACLSCNPLIGDAVVELGTPCGVSYIEAFQGIGVVPPEPPVTLGTPHGGSAIAHILDRNRFGRVMLGKSIEGALLGDMPPWQGEWELGGNCGD